MRDVLHIALHQTASKHCNKCILTAAVLLRQYITHDKLRIIDFMYGILLNNIDILRFVCHVGFICSSR